MTALYQDDSYLTACEAEVQADRRHRQRDRVGHPRAEQCKPGDDRRSVCSQHHDDEVGDPPGRTYQLAVRTPGGHPAGGYLRSRESRDLELATGDWQPVTGNR